MDIRQCQKCGAVNAIDVWDCYFCGSTLGVNTINNRDDIDEGFVQLISQYRIEKDETARCQMVSEISSQYGESSETSRFLEWVSKNDPSQSVGMIAQREALKRQPHKQVEINTANVDKTTIERPGGDATQIGEPKSVTYQKAYKYAAIFTIVNWVLDFIIGLLSGDLGIDLFFRLLLGAFLAINLFNYRNWARVWILILAVFYFIVYGINPFFSQDLVSALIVSIITLGYSIPIIILLAGIPSDTKNKVGLVIFILCSCIPYVLLILLMLLAPLL